MRMKFLQSFESKESAKNALEQLKQVGLVAHLSVDGSSTKGGALPGRHFVSLYSVLPEQHDDALKFLTNKKHRVRTGLSKKEMTELNNQLYRGVSKSLNKFILFGLLIVLSLFIYLVSQI